MKVLSSSDIAARQNAGVVWQSGDVPLGRSRDLISHGRVDSEVGSQIALSTFSDSQKQVRRDTERNAH